MSDPHEAGQAASQDFPPEGPRRGRGRRRGDPEWGDAVWIDAPASSDLFSRSDVGRGPHAGSADEPSDGAGTPSRSARGCRRRGEPAEVPEDRAEQLELARTVALRHLTGAPRSRRQLEDRLADRGVPGDVAAEVLDRLEAVRLVDDRAFAEMLVRAKHQGRGLARSALRRELREKGVEGEDAEHALDQVDDQDERRIAYELVEKKVRSRPVPTGGSPEERAARDRHVRRLVAMLARRGHAPGLAFDVVRDVIDAQEQN